MEEDLLASLKTIERKIHLRTQQRNGRKCITTIEGLDKDLDIKRIARAMRRAFNCNGSIEEDEQYGQIIKLQGDQRENIVQWLLDQEILTKQEADERIVRHG